MGYPCFIIFVRGGGVDKFYNLFSDESFLAAAIQVNRGIVTVDDFSLGMHQDGFECRIRELPESFLATFQFQGTT